MSVSLRELASATNGRAVVMAGGLSVLGSGAALLVPYVVGDGVNLLVAGHHAIYPTVAAIVGLLALRLTFEIGSTLIAGTERFRYVAALRSVWHDRVLALPPGSVADERRQEWVSILSYDIPRVAEVVVDLPISLGQAVVTLLGTLLLMTAIHPLLTALVFVAAPLSYIVARLAIHAVRTRAVRFWDLEVDVMSKAEEGFRASWAIQAFSQESRFRSRFAEAAKSASIAGVAHLRLLALTGPLIQFVTFGGMACIVLVASTGVGGMLEPGALLSFVLYGLLLSSPLRAFANGWSLWRETEATLGRFGALDALAPDFVEGSDDLPSARGDLEIVEVSFSWRDDVLLDNASLRIDAGQHVALVGPNGCGKTTLVALLLGFARPGAGELRVDGIALDTLNTNARRSLFAIAPQHGALFGGTIRENICFGRPDATPAEIARALDVSLASDFVAGLPQGLDTRIGDGGLQLSGGQRQRVALARALLVEAPILIIDEATSGFDAASADAFGRSVGALDCTVVWITHEEAPLAFVDRVVRVVDGAFTESITRARQAG